MLKVFADQGRTFTDIVCVTDNQAIADHLSSQPDRFLIVPLPNHQWIIVYKRLSENPELYEELRIQDLKVKS